MTEKLIYVAVRQVIYVCAYTYIYRVKMHTYLLLKDMQTGYLKTPSLLAPATVHTVSASAARRKKLSTDSNG